MSNYVYKSRPFELGSLRVVVMFLLALTASNCEFFSPSYDPPADAGYECDIETDCISAHGPAQGGCKWICEFHQCQLVGSCAQADAGLDDDPDAGSDPDQEPNSDAGTSPDAGIDPGCLGDVLGVIQEGLCTCECKDCDCTGIDCVCDITCYQTPPPPGCVVDVDENGNLIIDGNAFEDCTLECAAESDLSQDKPCTLNNCVVPTNNVDIQIQPDTELVENIEQSDIDINPESEMNVEMAALELEREIRPVDVLFVVDNSGSMSDDQMASACAMDKFLDAASADGAVFDTGVITTDIKEINIGLTGIANPNNCQVALDDCECRANGQLPPVPAGHRPCNFNHNGDWLDTSDPANWPELKKMIVQGDDGGSRESGLQMAFRLFATMETEGKFKGPYEIVVISDEYADANGVLCPFKASNDKADFDLQEQLKQSPLGWNPPAPAGTSLKCEKDLTAFYTYYFQSRGIIVHGLLLKQGKVPIYHSVIEATKGHMAWIEDCDAFQPFMEEVGNTTSDMSTQLCIEDPSVVQNIVDDLDRVILYYTDTGADELVPRSDDDGWRFDTTTNCFILSGEWTDKMGSFRVEYKGGPEQIIFQDVEICMDDFDPIVETILVTCDVNGTDTDVPQSDVNGWSLQTLGGQNCLVFTGDWREQELQCSVEYKESEDEIIFHDFQVCPDDFDPIVDSIMVTCDVNGTDTAVPQSNTDGWSLQNIGGKTCLVFTGSWCEEQRDCSLEYRDNP